MQKSEDDFGVYTSRENRIYKRKVCKDCRAEQEKYRYSKDPSLKAKAKDRDWKKNLQRLYGITEAQYNEMVKKQDGKCKICGATSRNRLNIDHCHKTGKVRGLLCWNCNIGIGYFKDSSNLLDIASKYLQGDSND
jgi:hypothetical protein